MPAKPFQPDLPPSRLPKKSISVFDGNVIPAHIGQKTGLSAWKIGSIDHAPPVKSLMSYGSSSVARLMMGTLI